MGLLNHGDHGGHRGLVRMILNEVDSTFQAVYAMAPCHAPRNTSLCHSGNNKYCCKNIYICPDKEPRAGVDGRRSTVAALQQRVTLLRLLLEGVPGMPLQV